LRSKTILGVKIIVLTIILLICYFLSAVISGLSSTLAEPSAQSPSSGTNVSLLLMFLVFLFPTIVLTLIILRSRWYGWRLIAAVFLAFYGVNTVLAQIESAIFLPEILPQGMILKLFIMGAIIAGIFSPIAVLILGKMKRKEESLISEQLLGITSKNIPAKLPVISVIYMLLYFIFGYFIAWKNPLIQNYYGAKDAGNFFAQLAWI